MCVCVCARAKSDFITNLMTIIIFPCADYYDKVSFNIVHISDLSVCVYLTFFV